MTKQELIKKLQELDYEGEVFIESTQDEYKPNDITGMEIRERLGLVLTSY